LKYLLSVVIPTFNEAKNLPDLIEALLETITVSPLQLIVVDDNSPDDTGKIADELAEKYYRGPETRNRRRIQVIHRNYKQGLGSAYLDGIQYALNDKSDFVVQMDADLSHSPKYIMRMYELISKGNVDVVIGSRYVEGGCTSKNWGIWRRFLSRFANIYCRMILNANVHDMTSGFKLWRREALEGICIETIKSTGYSFQVEMVYRCRKLGYNLVETPICFIDRQVGKSKLSLEEKIVSAIRIWQIKLFNFK
jgi:dolichol-phosphate mannosyltransferase